MSNIFKFLLSALSDATTGEASTHRLSYFMVVCILCATLGAIAGIFVGIAIMSPPSIELLKAFTSAFETVAGMAIAATTTGYLGKKYFEKAPQNTVTDEVPKA